MRTFVISILSAFTMAAQAQTLALTFDDGLNPDREPRAREWNSQLLGGLTASGITSMIFPSLSRVGGISGQALVADWSALGHYVGNHTSGHRNLGSKQISLPEFIEDVVEADKAFNHLPTWLPMLRFPYLKEGNTEDKRDGIREWMRTHGYRSAPVSIDTSDWYFNQVWLTFQSPSNVQKRETLRQEYIDHLLARADYYQALAKRTLKSSPIHVMLLRVNAINAASISQISKAFRSRGWDFVSPVQAFADPVYLAQPITLPAGESIIWALAKENGEKGLRYPAEDSSYEEPVLRAKGLLLASSGG